MHDGSLNMLNDSIKRHFTGLLGYDAALTLCMQDNLFHAFGAVCWFFFFFQNNVKKIFQEHYQSVKRLGSRSGPMF